MGQAIGLPYNSQLSFAFPQVRDYKLGLVKEILAYDIDGFFFDWMRTGDVRNGPQADATGTADFGYEKPLVEGFIKNTKRTREPLRTMMKNGCSSAASRRACL